jgi:hypothetical protein
MSFQRLGFCLSLALCLAARTSPALAQPVGTESASATTTPRPTAKAVVILVSAAGRDLELRVLLAELLDRTGVSAEIVAQPQFGKEELLREATRDGAVHVFVVPGVAGNVGLYFRGPDGERFLLRSVLLRGGLDDLGREQIAQIVETAVVSLSIPGAGMTRAQASVALDDPEAPNPEAPRADTPSNMRTKAAAQPSSEPLVRARLPPKNADPSAAGRVLEGWFAIRYGATSLGTPIGIAHGPGLELGLGARRGWVLRGRLTGERDFAQTLSTSLVTAELSSIRLRLAADVGVVVAPGHVLLASLAVGQDRIAVTPRATSGSSIAPAAAFSSRSPIAHAELRYEAGSASLRLGAALGADASLVETHYDVEHPTGRERVVKPWLVRPTSSLTLAYCPRWATF